MSQACDHRPISPTGSPQYPGRPAWKAELWPLPIVAYSFPESEPPVAKQCYASLTCLTCGQLQIDWK